MRSKLLKLLLGAYGLALGYFQGLLYMAVIPFKWPADVITGYLLGGSIGLFVAFTFIKRWDLHPITKTIAAVVLLIFVAAVCLCFQSLIAQVTRLEMILEFMQK